MIKAHGAVSPRIEAPPAYPMGSFTASTEPGCRAPHFVLGDGRSVYDAFGSDYTLLRFDATVDGAPLVAAARECGRPLAELDIAREITPDECRHTIVLCRADQHVARSGDTVPADPTALVDRMRGAAPRSPSP